VSVSDLVKTGVGRSAMEVEVKIAGYPSFPLLWLLAGCLVLIGMTAVESLSYYTQQ
jgi:hypothetical protein